MGGNKRIKEVSKAAQDDLKDIKKRKSREAPQPKPIRPWDSCPRPYARHPMGSPFSSFILFYLFICFMLMSLSDFRISRYKDQILSISSLMMNVNETKA